MTLKRGGVLGLGGGKRVLPGKSFFFGGLQSHASASGSGSGSSSSSASSSARSRPVSNREYSSSSGAGSEPPVATAARGCGCEGEEENGGGGGGGVSAAVDKAASTRRPRPAASENPSYTGGQGGNGSAVENENADAENENADVENADDEENGDEGLSQPLTTVKQKQQQQPPSAGGKLPTTADDGRSSSSSSPRAAAACTGAEEAATTTMTTAATAGAWPARARQQQQEEQAAAAATGPNKTTTVSNDDLGQQGREKRTCAAQGPGAAGVKAGEATAAAKAARESPGRRAAAGECGAAATRTTETAMAGNERAALLRQRVKDVKVSISGYASVAAAKPFVVYRIKVDCGRGVTWHVFRRFSAFLTLEYTLKQIQPDFVECLPALPARLSFELSPELVRERASGLHFWIRSAAALWARIPALGPHSQARCSDYLCKNIVSFLSEKADQSPLFPGDRIVHLDLDRRATAASALCSDADLTSDEEGEKKTGSAAEPTARRPEAAIASPTAGSNSSNSVIGNACCVASACTPEEGPVSPCKPVCCPADQASEPAGPEAATCIGPGEFVLRKVIGKGSFGEVFLATRKDACDGAGTPTSPSSVRSPSQKIKAFAVKALGKAETVRRKQTRRIETERRCMVEGRGCPFIVNLEAAIMSDSHLFFIQEFCSGGELYFHLDVHGKFSSRLARFITGECALALAHLHERGIVYRDLKPENIMIDADGHVKLVDFGLARTGISSPHQGALSFVGTTEYLSPEMLKKSGHGFAVDYWALGMVLYEMLTGLPPWYSDDKKAVTRGICEGQVDFPANEVSRNARSLIRHLLIKDPAKRLGSTQGIKELSEHPYFAPLDFRKLAAKRIKPPFVPHVRSSLDTSCFDYNFTSLPARVPSHQQSKTRTKDESVVASAQADGVWNGFAYAPHALSEK